MEEVGEDEVDVAFVAAVKADKTKGLVVDRAWTAHRSANGPCEDRDKATTQVPASTR